MTTSKARLADKQHDIQNAIDLYETTIIEGYAEFLDYVNLVCIYFNCLSLGYTAANNIREDIRINCSKRALELIDEAEKKFGVNDELTFWKSYIPFLGWGDEIGEWDLLGDSLVPYVYLALEFPTDKNIQKGRQFYTELKNIESSERKNLFMSILEDVIE